MRGYTQLTRDERYQIYALRKAGHSQKEIAEVLRRNPSTISRELGRNKGLKGYRPEQAHRLAQNRKKERDRTRIPESTWARVEQLLREDWSPEQISGWLTREEGVSVSHERIYQHVYEDKRRGGDLHCHLRCQKPRRKRYGHYDRRGQIRERVSIDERPEVVEARSRIGDWEADTVIGKLGGAVLVTLVERRSRLRLIALAHPAVPAQGNRLQQTDGQAGPGDHGQVEQSPSKMPGVQDTQSGILRDQTARCTSELNPPILPFAVGRRNWLFADTPRGARASATVYSLIETAKANGLEPFTYLHHVLQHIGAASTVEDIEALLPWNVDLKGMQEG